jgi:hypothetical protein
MIDINDPAQFDALMLRVQARRVAQCFMIACQPCSPGAAVLAGDTKEAVERDGEAFAQWCAARGIDSLRVLGTVDFRPAP